MKKFFSLTLLLATAGGLQGAVTLDELVAKINVLEGKVDSLQSEVNSIVKVRVVSSQGLSGSDAAKELQGQVAGEQREFEQKVMQIQQDMQEKQVALQNAMKAKMPQSVIEKHQEDIASLQRKGKNLQEETQQRMESKYRALGDKHTHHIVASTEKAAKTVGADIVITEEGRILSVSPKAEITNEVLKESNKLHKIETAAKKSPAAKKIAPKAAPAA